MMKMEDHQEMIVIFPSEFNTQHKELKQKPHLVDSVVTINEAKENITVPGRAWATTAQEMGEEGFLRLSPLFWVPTLTL